MKNLLISLFVLLAFSACKSIYTIHTDEEKKEGIPFLTKTVQLEQQSIYALPFYEVVLEVEPLQGDSVAKGMKPVRYQPVRTPADRNNDLRRLQTLLQSINTVNNLQLVEIVKRYHELPQITENAGTVTPVSNTVNRKIVVDEQMYYLNGNRKVFGSSSLDFELNSDNTLTKGQASVEADYSIITDVLSTVIPVSDLITSVLKLDEAEEVTEEEMEGIEKNFKDWNIPLIEIEPDEQEDLSYRLSLTITGGAYQYTFTEPVASYAEAKTQIPFSTEDGFFIRQEVKEKSSKKSEATEKKEENAVKINGSIVFPDKKGEQ